MPSFPAGVCANRPCESQAELAGTALGDKTVSVSSMRGSSFSHWLGSPQGLSEASLALGLDTGMLWLLSLGIASCFKHLCLLCLPCPGRLLPEDPAVPHLGGVQ